MSEKHTEQVLQDLYAKRKQQVTAPKLLNDKILMKANAEKKPLWRWLNGPAIALSFVLVIVFGIQKNATEPVVEYVISEGIINGTQVIYYHDLKSNTVKIQHLAKPEKADPHENYMLALNALQDRKELRGILTYNDQDVVIKVCDLGLVQISKEIVNQMDMSNSLQKIDVGEPVTLLADNRGRINDILAVDWRANSQSAEMCE